MHEKVSDDIYSYSHLLLSCRRKVSEVPVMADFFVRFPPKNTEYFSVLKFKSHRPVTYQSADTLETSFTLAAAVWMGTSRYEVPGKAEKPERCQEKLYAAACLGGLPVLLMGGGAHIESPPRCQQ